MGCATSSTTTVTTGGSTETRYPYNHQRTTDNNTNNLVKDNSHNKPDTTVNTNNTGGGGTYYPDDNAIYGFDLYGDDHVKKEDGKNDQSQKEGDGVKPEGNETSDLDHTRAETNAEETGPPSDQDQTRTDTNANESQFDEKGFFGQTDDEKRDQELFDDAGQKREDDTAENQTDVIPPPAVTDDITKEEEGEQEGKRVEENKEEERVEEKEETPEETIEENKEEEKVAEGDVVVPPPDDGAKEEAVLEQEEKEPEIVVCQFIPLPELPLTEVDEVTEEAVEQLKTQPDEGAGFNGDGDYTKTATGLMTLFLDLRTVQDDDDKERQPDPRPALGGGQLWEDSDFNLYQAITDHDLAQTLTWKRPSEISNSPILFSKGTTRYDIGQGGAGTCWFLSTVANVSEHPEQLQQVIPEDAYPVGTEDYKGVFHSRFWRFGKWEDVYIDDFLPIIHGTIPWGARSATDENEFWVSLLEKSFARYHGSYNAVYGGQPGDAYLALTGGVAERIDFDDNEHRPAKLFRRIHNAINSDALITCTVPSQYDNVCGLVGGHAYSLTGTGKAKGTRLLRVRNPWGNTEWKGPWSDGSGEWAGVSQDEIAQVVKDDGEFWMCLKDFMTYFDQTTICSLTPDFDMDGCSDSLNYVTNIYGEWKGDTAAGFRDKLRNPRFLFTVTESESVVPVVVQLIQKRQDRQVDNFQVRCDLYKVFGDNGTIAAMELMGENTNSYCPETQCSFRHKITPGTYAIVPSAIEEGLEKSFLIRVFSGCALKDVRELSRDHKLMSCERETSYAYKGQEHELEFCQTMSGGWKAGVNAGGQVGNRDTHATNPQFVISVTQPTLVVMHVMQEQSEPRMPVGLRLFPTGEAPLNIDQIYDLYDDSVVDTDGTNYKFVQSWDVKTAYMLNPGQYTLLLHLDQPNTEKLYMLLLKSTQPVDVKGYQTGE